MRARLFGCDRRRALTIWLELLIAALMVPMLALLHGWGLLAMSRLFNITDEQLLHRKLGFRSIGLVAFVATLLFTIHGVEIGSVALLYRLGGASPTFHQALALSASYYTTTGAGPENLPDGWRLVGQAEALLGLLLIGWSTAYLVRKIERLQEPGGAVVDERRRERLRGGGYGGRGGPDAGG